MTERNKRIFLSDLHISHIPKIGPGKYDYTWLQRKDADALTNFLKYLNTRQDVEEVIFIGDLFDNWVIPVYIEPPTIDEIITSRKAKKDPLMQALVDLCQNSNIRVVCLPGNHDMELTEEVVETHFKNNSDRQRPGMILAVLEPGMPVAASIAPAASGRAWQRTRHVQRPRSDQQPRIAAAAWLLHFAGSGYQDLQHGTRRPSLVDLYGRRAGSGRT